MEPAKPAPLSRRALAALHIGAWLAMSAIFLAIMASSAIPLGKSVLLVAANFGALAGLFYGHTWLVDRFWERGRLGAFVLRSVPLLALDGTLRFLATGLLLKDHVRAEPATLFPPFWRLGIFVLVTGFLFAVVAVVFRLLANRVVRERAHLALLAEQGEAQLRLLKGQVNPHFLFNALHNAYALAVQKSDEAPRLLLQLSDLLRYAIYESHLPEVPLEKEAGAVRRFIDLSQVRFERPADVFFEIKGGTAGRSIEPMLLVPLVENCFKHGNLGAGNGAFCRIFLENGADKLLFSTQNTFDPADRQKDPTGGIGLENIRRRLELRYPGRHRFEFAGDGGGVFEVRLEIGF